MLQCKCVTLWEIGTDHTMGVAESCSNLDITGLYKNGLPSTTSFLLLCECQLCFIFLLWPGLMLDFPAERREIQILVFQGGGGTRVSVEAGSGMMCTCTCKTGAWLQHKLQLRGAMLSLELHGSAKPLHLSVWPGSSLFMCMEPFPSMQDHVAAGAICLPCCIHSSACSPSRSVLPSSLAAWLVSPFFSPFFSLLWQSSLVGKAKQGVSVALQCKQTSSNWTLTGKICAAQCGHHSRCELQGKTARQVKSLKDLKDLSSLTVSVFVRNRLKLICELALKI